MTQPFPVVSVVIPTHNRARLLNKAIGSVLSQTYRDLEVIVIDDNSSDDTKDAVLACHDRRIRYIKHVRNRGGSASRNTGIRAAKGKYIAFLDDDDKWEPEKLEAQINAIGNFDIILCRVRLTTSGKVHTLYKYNDIKLKDLKKGFIFGGGTSTILGKATAIKKTLFDEGLGSAQDWDFLVRLATRYRIKYHVRPLVLFNNGTHSRISKIVTARTIPALEQRAQAFYKHRDLIGPFWFNFHLGRCLLYGLSDQDNKLGYLFYVIGRCGIRATALALYNAVKRKLIRLNVLQN